MKLPKLKLLFTIAIILLPVSAYFLIDFRRTQKSASPKTAPTVSVSDVTESHSQPTLDAIGILQANQGTILKAQTDGQIKNIYFSAGDTVKTGDVLVIFNNTEQQGALDAAFAQEQLNKTTYERDLELQKLGAISLAAVDQAKAAVEGGAATVQQAQGAYDLTVIEAPFSGRVGISKVYLGDYLKAGDAIVSLQNTDPMFVDFYVPQRYFSSIHIGEKVMVRANTVQQDVQGQVVNYETVIDQATGMLQVRASVPNPQQNLLPGGYATLHVNIGNVGKIIDIPQTAIMYDAQGPYVYLVKDNVAHIQRISVGSQIEQKIQVLQGLETGDRIVISGTNKVRNGELIQGVSETDKAST